MTVRFTVLGYEVAKLTLDMDPSAPRVEDVPAVDKVIEKISDWWVRRMLKQHVHG